MKAIRVYAPGGLEALRYEETALPEPQAGEVRVQVAAVGLNFIDVYQRSGQYKMALPFTPGVEASGVVEKLGPDVEGVAVGDRVAYCMQPGAYGDYAIAPAWKLVPVPPSISLEVATALMVPQPRARPDRSAARFWIEGGASCDRYHP